MVSLVFRAMARFLISRRHFSFFLDAPLLCAKAMASHTFWKVVSNTASGYFFIADESPTRRASST